MKNLKEMLAESTKINESKPVYSDDIKDMVFDIMPGETELGDYGVIIGKPFDRNDKRGRAKAEKLLKTLGLMDSISQDPDDVDAEFEASGSEICYFLERVDDEAEVNCYSFGMGGVWILK
jgi:hypothetical protein